MTWSHPHSHAAWPVTQLSAVDIGPFELDPALAPIVDQNWDALTTKRAHLFDGPLLHLDSFDPASGLLRCARSSYRVLAAGRAGIDTGLRALGVSGLVRCDDHVLMARRASIVFHYAGRWELAPSGVAEPARANANDIDLVGQLLRELREETGADAGPADVAPMMLAWDSTTRTYDACFVIRLTQPITPAPSPEYEAIRWMTRNEARALGDELIPVSRMMLDALD
jgi:8-oxo-dGTP pyrophosphatase MutT (NUDIX family)